MSPSFSYNLITEQASKEGNSESVVIEVKNILTVLNVYGPNDDTMMTKLDLMT